jgi:hypothetical protein
LPGLPDSAAGGTRPRLALASVDQADFYGWKEWSFSFPSRLLFLNSLDRSLARAAMSAIDPPSSAAGKALLGSGPCLPTEHFFQRGRSDEGAEAAQG